MLNFFGNFKSFERLRLTAKWMNELAHWSIVIVNQLNTLLFVQLLRIGFQNLFMTLLHIRSPSDSLSIEVNMLLFWLSRSAILQKDLTVGELPISKGSRLLLLLLFHLSIFPFSASVITVWIWKLLVLSRLNLVLLWALSLGWIRHLFVLLVTGPNEDSGANFVPLLCKFVPSWVLVNLLDRHFWFNVTAEDVVYLALNTIGYAIVQSIVSGIVKLVI